LFTALNFDPSMATLALASRPILRHGVVTLSEASLILAIEQQAKSLKSHASTLTFVGEFHSI
jgi:hypothetical protein